MVPEVYPDSRILFREQHLTQIDLTDYTKKRRHGITLTTFLF